MIPCLKKLIPILKHMELDNFFLFYPCHLGGKQLKATLGILYAGQSS